MLCVYLVKMIVFFHYKAEAKNWLLKIFYTRYCDINQNLIQYIVDCRQMADFERLGEFEKK